MNAEEYLSKRLDIHYIEKNLDMIQILALRLSEDGPQFDSSLRFISDFDVLPLEK